MADQLSIENLSLSRLGEAPITTVGDSSERALALAAIYPTIRDVVLSDYPWNFATVRAKLSMYSMAPIFGYRYRYPKPMCLKFWGICGCRGEVDPRLRYEIEGTDILTNVLENGSLPVKYTIQITDETQFSPLFVSAFAFRLAAEVAYRLTRDTKLEAAMMAAYQKELSKATAEDAKQGTQNVVLPHKWQHARQTGHDGAGWLFPIGAPDLTPAGIFWLAPVLSRTATPPVSPNIGDRYLVDDNATGSWYGYDGCIAEYVEVFQMNSWQFNAPGSGSAVIVMDTKAFEIFSGPGPGIGYANPPLLPGVSFWLTPVLSKTNTPPTSPGEGDRYLVDTGGVYAWTGLDGDIAVWQAGTWTATIPPSGSAVIVNDTQTIEIFA